MLMKEVTTVVFPILSSLITQIEYSVANNWLWITILIVAIFAWLSRFWLQRSKKAQENPSESQKTARDVSEQYLDQLYNSIENTIKQKYGVENLEPLMAKKLLAIGDAAYKCYDTFKQPKNKNGSALGLFLKNETAEESFNKLPNRMEALESSINDKIKGLNKELNEKSNLLEGVKAELQNLESKRNENEKKIKQLSNESDDLRKQVADLIQKNANLLDRLTSTEKELNQKDTVISKLETKLKEREEKIGNLQNESDSLRKKLEGLEHIAQKIDQIERIKSSIPYLNQGQRNFLEGSNETGSPAVLCFLINYSLFQMYRAIFDENLINETRRNAMLVNLYLITRRLERIPGFNGASEELVKNFSNIGSLEGTLVCSEARHYNDRLFQVLLKYIHDYSRIDLTPFYFDSDANGKVYCVN